jgi:hypothetical protein
MNRFALVSLLALLAFSAFGQTPTRVRGTITGLDGDILSVKSREGKDLKLHLASLDAKKEWDEKLEPRVQQLKNAPQEKLNELASLLESYAARLRAADITP